MGEEHVAGEVTQVVHDTVDTEVVSVGGIIAINRRLLLVKRQFSHTVDGIACVVGLLRHTVAGTLEHDTTTPDGCHVATLDGVQQTTGVDRAEAELIKVSHVGRAIFTDELRVLEKVFKLVGGHTPSGTVRLVVLIPDSHALLHTVVQYEVGALTVAHAVVRLLGDGLISAVVVGTIVTNMQLAPTIDECQVTITIEATHMLCAESDEVAVVDIAQGCRHISKDGRGAGRHLVATRGDISTSEDSIMDGDTRLIIDEIPSAVMVLIL